MTDAEKVKIMKFALETLAIADMGDAVWAYNYEEQVKQLARAALADTSDVLPQD